MTDEIDLRAALNAVSDVVQNRPRPLREFDQIYVRQPRWQISQHQYAAGVLVAQAAVEMGARNAFIRLLYHSQQDEVTDDQLTALPDVSFMHEETRRLWALLSEYRVTRPKDPPVWQRYHWHVECRNKIAHGDMWGDTVGYDCVVAAGAFIMRLDEQMAAFDAAHP